MTRSINKPALVTATLVGSIALAGSAFAATPLAQGYMLGAQDAAPAEQAQAGHDKMQHEGRCGMDKMDTDGDGRISSAEFAASHDGDASKFAEHDANGDGFVDASEMKAHKEGNCGADRKAEGGVSAKADMEGKCGEGKCGGSV